MSFAEAMICFGLFLLGMTATYWTMEKAFNARSDLRGVSWMMLGIAAAGLASFGMLPLLMAIP